MHRDLSFLILQACTQAREQLNQGAPKSTITDEQLTERASQICLLTLRRADWLSQQMHTAQQYASVGGAGWGG